MLYTKPIDDIKEQDIRQFIQNPDLEGTTFDVKKDFPKDGLEKIISAFANTYGGIIIVGVYDKHEKGKPKDLLLKDRYDPIGIEYFPDYKTRITNQLYNKVHPIITPEIKTIQFATNDKKCFIFIRVAQSFYAPHFILGTNEISYRYNDRCGLMDLATIHRLLNQRDANMSQDKDLANPFLCSDTIYFRLDPSFNVNPILWSSTLEEGIRKIVDKYIIAVQRATKRTRNTVVFSKEMFQLNNGEEGYSVVINNNGSIEVCIRDTSIITPDELDLFETVRMHKKFFYVAQEVLKLFSYYGDSKIQFIITSAHNNGPQSDKLRVIKGTNTKLIVSQDKNSLLGGFSDVRQISYHELRDSAYLKVLFLTYNDLFRECNECPNENDLQNFLKSPAVI